MLGVSLFLNLPIYQKIDREPSWTYNIQDNEHDQIDKRKFTLRQHCVVNIKKSHSHRYDHRNDSDSYNKSRYKKKRTAEFTENTYHKAHVAAESKNIRKRLGQFIKIGHLVKPMYKEHYTKEDSEAQNQKGNSLPSEGLWKQKIVKHSA